MLRVAGQSLGEPAGHGGSALSASGTICAHLQGLSESRRRHDGACRNLTFPVMSSGDSFRPRIHWYLTAPVGARRARRRSLLCGRDTVFFDPLPEGQLPQHVISWPSRSPNSPGTGSLAVSSAARLLSDWVRLSRLPSPSGKECASLSHLSRAQPIASTFPIHSRKQDGGSRCAVESRQH